MILWIPPPRSSHTGYDEFLPDSTRQETLGYLLNEHKHPFGINNSKFHFFVICFVLQQLIFSIFRNNSYTSAFNSSTEGTLFKCFFHTAHDARHSFGICFKEHFDARYLVFCNPSPPRMFLSLDLLIEYRIQHGAIGPLYVTSSYSTWIFCMGVSGFVTDCPCEVWCRGLTTCLLHVGPPFGNRFLNTSLAVGLTYWVVYLHFFCILKYAIIYVLIHHIIWGLYLYFLNILYFQVLLY